MNRRWKMLLIGLAGVLVGLVLSNYLYQLKQNVNRYETYLSQELANDYRQMAANIQAIEETLTRFLDGGNDPAAAGQVAGLLQQTAALAQDLEYAAATFEPEYVDRLGNRSALVTNLYGVYMERLDAGALSGDEEAKIQKLNEMITGWQQILSRQGLDWTVDNPSFVKQKEWKDVMTQMDLLANEYRGWAENE